MKMDVMRFGLIHGMVAGLCIVLCSCAPDKTDLEYLQQAKLFQAQNQWRAAMIEFKNALQKNPQNLEARQLLGMLYLDIGEAEAAENELRRVAAAGSATAKFAAPIARAMLLQKQQDKLLAEFSAPRFDERDDSPELQGLRAEALASLGKLEPAQTTIVKAISQEPVSVAVMLSAAHVALARGKVDEARNWVHRALELSPTDPNAWLLSADLAFVATQHDAAAQDYQRALDFDQRQLLTQRNLRARVGIVFALLAQGKQDAALPHIEVLLAANPKHFLSNYLRGLVAYKKADFKTALDYLQRSTQTAPPNSPATALLGAVHYSMGNYQQAEVLLSRYVDAAPDDLAARKLLGATRLKLNQPEKAMEALGASTEQSDDSQLLAMLGEAASMSGEFRAGRDYFRRALKGTKTPGLLQTQLAQTFLEEGDYEHAIAELQRATQDTQAEKRAKILTVMAYLRKNDTAAALKAAQALLAEKPNDPEMANLLGGVYLVQKQFKAAREQYQHALTLQPKFVPGLLNLGTLDWREKNPTAARTQFLHVFEIDPKNQVAMQSLAQVEYEDNQPAAAAEWLEKARASDAAAVEPRLLLAQHYLRGHELEKADGFVQEAFKLRPAHPPVLSMLADVQLARGQFAQAAATLEALIKTQPKDANAHFRLGRARVYLRQFAQARASLRQAMTLAPDAAIVVAGLVALEVQQSNVGVAQELVDKYIKQHPDAADGYTLRGDVMMAQKRFDTAEQAYERAAQIQPSTVLTLKRYRALSSLGGQPRALELLQSWLQTHPQDDLVLLELADAYRNAGRATEAADIYNKMLVAKPNEVTVLNNLALAYLASHDPRALATAEAAYKQAPQHPYVADTYGWVLLQSGDAKKSKPILEQANSKLPGQADIQTHLAISLEQNSEPERARELLLLAMKNKQAFESRPIAEAALKRLQTR